MPPSTTASIQLTANPSRLPAALRSAANMVASFASGVRQVMSKVNLAPQNTLKRPWAQHMVGNVMASAAKRGLDAIIDQGRDVFDFNEKLVRLGIASRKTGRELDLIGNAARRVSNETGRSASEVLDAGRAYLDLAGAANFSTQKMRLLATAGQASEAAGADLAAMMYQLTVSMKVTDSQMEDTMGGLINQAKDGAIEARQMAKEFGAMMPLFAKFGVIGREGAVQAGAMFQVIRDGYNSSDEAGTGIVRIFAGLRSHASRFAKHGVRIFNVDKNGVKTARAFSDIFADIQKSVLAKDPELLKKAFGRTEAWRGFELLLKPENIARLRELEKSGRANGIIMRDLGTFTDSAAGKMAVAFERMKNTIAEAFTPERITAFVAAIEGLGEKLRPIVDLAGAAADAVGKISGLGRSMRKLISGDEPALRPSTGADVEAYKQLHPGASDADAVQGLQRDWARTLKFKKEVEAAAPNNTTTNASDKLVVRAFMEAESGSDLLNAAVSYMNNTGMSPERRRDLEAQIREEDARKEKARAAEREKARIEAVDAAIKSGAASSRREPKQEDFDAMVKRGAAAAAAEGGRSFAPRTITMDDAQRLIDQSLAPAIMKALIKAMDARQMEVNLDGNTIARSTKGATDQRRR